MQSSWLHELNEFGESAGKKFLGAMIILENKWCDVKNLITLSREVHDLTKNNELLLASYFQKILEEES